MIRAVDHIVFAVAADERRRLADRLLAAGFKDIPLELDFPEIGAASESYAMAGGGFVELVYETRAGAAPPAWFDEVPRVIGLGFMSDDFEADVAGWGEDGGGWVMDEDTATGDGSMINIHAAGPHPHFEAFYVFAMDRRELPYAALGAEPRLETLTFVGSRAAAWRDDLAAWLQLAPVGDELRVGDVALRFRPGNHPGVRVSPAFAVGTPTDPIALAAGHIDFDEGAAGMSVENEGPARDARSLEELDLPEVDFFGAAYLTDPQAVCRAAREQSWAARTEHGPLVLTHADVNELSANREGGDPYTRVRLGNA